MLQKSLPVGVVVPVLMAVVGGFALIDNQIATRATTTPPKRFSYDYCIKCHTNDKVLAAMRDKAGDPRYMDSIVKRYKQEHPGVWKPGSDLAKYHQH